MWEKGSLYLRNSKRKRFRCLSSLIIHGLPAHLLPRLVCSDLISRGMDISHVSHVVSYDVPVDMRKYVHRVGRTARAGRSGDAWTLVEEQEVSFSNSFLNVVSLMLDLKFLGEILQVDVKRSRSY